jgi:hypothetical protein
MKWGGVGASCLPPHFGRPECGLVGTVGVRSAGDVFPHRGGDDVDGRGGFPRDDVTVVIGGVEILGSGVGHVAPSRSGWVPSRSSSASTSSSITH